MEDKQPATTAVAENNQVTSFAKPTEDTETPEEKAAYSKAWEEALIDSGFQDKIKLTKERIERLNKLTCETPKEELDRQKAIRILNQNLAELESGNKPKRHNQKDRIKVRKIAKELWAVDPSITIEDMSHNKKIISITSRHYKSSTIRTWIKDLAPDRSPGRRKSKSLKQN